MGDKAALLYTGHQFKVRNDYQIDNTNNSDYLLFFHTITKLTGMIVCGIRKRPVRIAGRADVKKI